MNSRRARSIVATGVRTTLAVLVAAQGVICEGAVLREQRFTGLPGGVVGMSIVNLVVYGAAVVALLTWSRIGRLPWHIAALVPALVLTLVADAPVARRGTVAREAWARATRDGVLARRRGGA
jgi:hypothetical protein